MPSETSKSALQSIGNYDIVHKIAEGGMGTVYKARHKQSGLLVAIKTLPPTTAKNPVLLRRFEQEFRAAAILDHPNVVKAIEYCGTGPSPFLVMEFVDGESLGTKIERDGRMPEAEAIRIIAQVCQGLHRAHKQGLIHRDVKPDNIMVTHDGVAKLTDLGLVKDLEGEMNLTRTGRGLGTPHFMAPEQFRNAKNADVRCDIYSLGATLYMMVTGEIPFGKCGPLDCWMKKVHNDFPPPRDVVRDLSERLDWAIRRAMSADTALRPESCREFVEDLAGHSIKNQSVDASQALDLWYLVYRDEMNQTHTVKGSADGIRRALKEGLLGDASNVRAAKSKAGPFQPLKGYPEFRDLVIEPAALQPLSPTSPPGTTTPGSSGSSKSNPSNWNRSTTGDSSKATQDPDAVNLGEVPLDRGASASRSHKRPTSGRHSQPPAVEGPTVAYPQVQQQQQPAQASNSRLPHIPIQQPKGTDWFVYILVILLAAASGMIAYMFLQQQQ